MKYDVFISHASEDKAAFVRPLAELLASWRVTVWYDEFTLRPGDSLSASIDRGLSDSRFGVVVLSKAFLSKHWPEYELRGLISLGVGQPNRIVPVWYQVSRSDVLAFSPTLADRVAVVADDRAVPQAAYRLLATLRPDLHEHLTRYLLYLRQVRDAPLTLVEASELKPSPIRHESLPRPLLARVQLVHAAIGALLGLTYDEMVDNFKRDLHPARELEIWEGMAAAFQRETQGRRLSHVKRRAIALHLLKLSMTDAGETART
ncbi:MAG: toll/interleukin-1 receptor domain-containing protein [Desulfobulbaceae bacterium]|nr:toll/interleukin-1 receptor domain-containing protein [Desulfobulbaceae bacterium]